MRQSATVKRTLLALSGLMLVVSACGGGSSALSKDEFLKLFMAQLEHQDPLSPERLAARRAAVLDFISAALFQHSALPVEGESK